MWDILLIIAVCVLFLYLRWSQAELNAAEADLEKSLKDLRTTIESRVMVVIERVDDQLLVFRADNKLFLTQGTNLIEISKKLQDLPQSRSRPTAYLTYTQNLKELNLLE